MVVYADVLFFLNCVIDFLLIGITSVFIKRKTKAIRQIIASLLGGISSFYIFVDNNNSFIDITYRVATAFVIISVAFGVKMVSNFLKAVCCYFASSLFLFGITYFIYSRLKTPQIVLNNTYFYFDFSPLLSIFITTVVYFTIKISRHFASKKILSKECEIEFNIKDNFVTANGYIDTGNLAKDYLSDSELCFVSEKLLSRLTGSSDFSQISLLNEYKNRYRAIPVTTLNETVVLQGLRCDSGKIIVKENVYFLHKPIIVLSKNLPQNFDAIISAKALEKSPDKILKGDTIETYS